MPLLRGLIHKNARETATVSNRITGQARRFRDDDRVRSWFAFSLEEIVVVVDRHPLWHSINCRSILAKFLATCRSRNAKTDDSGASRSAFDNTDDRSLFFSHTGKFLHSFLGDRSRCLRSFNADRDPMNRSSDSFYDARSENDIYLSMYKTSFFNLPLERHESRLLRSNGNEEKKEERKKTKLCAFLFGSLCTECCR